MISDIESYDLFLRAFLDSLELLSLDANTQCEENGYYNVASELQAEIENGTYIVANPLCRFTEYQRGEFETILGEIRRIPTTVIYEAKTQESNLKAMKHECWESLRERAKAFLASIEDHAWTYAEARPPQ